MTVMGVGELLVLLPLAFGFGWLVEPLLGEHLRRWLA